jgi:predicted nucleotidyltransferase
VTLEDAIGRVLTADRSVRLAVLFGSTARTTARPASDVDIAVLGVDPGALGALEGSLARATGRRVELIALETAPPLLRFEIARDGQVLLERAPHSWSDFKARAMVDWWDWAPTARRFHRAAAERLRERHGPA